METGGGSKAGSSAAAAHTPGTHQDPSQMQNAASLTSPVNGGHFDYPPTLKSRGSPASGRQRPRSPPSTSPTGSSRVGLGGALSGTFIGGAFGKSVKHSLTGRQRTASPWSSSIPHPRLRNTRSAKLIIACTAALILWWVLLREREAPPSPRLKTRWWENGTAEELARLLPKPSMPVKPPKPKPPAVIMHTRNQLSRLPTTFSAASPPDWTAIIHLTSPAQFPMLASLIPSALHQSVPPHAVIVLAPEGITPPLSAHGPIVSLTSYPTSKPPILALVSTSSAALTTDYLLLIDASLDTLQPSYARTLLHAAGTKEYAATLLSTGGLVLPTSASAPPTACVPAAQARGTKLSGLEQSLPVHVPSTPSLLQSTWLALVTHGLRTDIPLEAALALALWTKAGIPAFALPLTIETPQTHADFGCERLKRALQLKERSLGQFWGVEFGPAGGGLRARRKAEAAAKTKTEDELRRAGWPRSEGAIVVLVSGKDELKLVRPLACGLSERPDLDVRIYLADRDDDDDAASVADGAYIPDKGAEDESPQRCHLDLRPLGTGTVGESVSIALVDEFDKIGRVEVVIYASDGVRAREFDEVLKWQGGVFAPGQSGGGPRRTRQQAEDQSAQGGTVVISLTKDEIVSADWLSALPLAALRHWHTPRIDLSVVTNDRPRSLYRLLNSLQNAMYFGDDVSLLLNLEQTADSDTQQLADEFSWTHGTVNVRHRIVLGGLMPAIVESWYPSSNDSYGVFLEDDVEVSPHFYGWLKFSILQYRYGTSELRAQAERMFGISLYQPRNVELRPEGRQPFDAHQLFESMSLASNTPYLSQIPCSWGAAYFPEVWREFHSYLSLRLSELAIPITETIVPEIKSNRWPRSWKKYFIELVYMRGYVMLYPNYPDFGSLSTNHVEKGTHIKSDADLEKRRRLFEVPLLTRDDTLLDLPTGRLPDWDTLPVLDLWGSLATTDALMERGWQTLAQLDTCSHGPPRLDRPVSHNARELLCKREYERVNRLFAVQPLPPAQGLGVAATRAQAAADAAAAAAAAAAELTPEDGLDDPVDGQQEQYGRIDRSDFAPQAVVRADRGSGGGGGVDGRVRAVVGANEFRRPVNPGAVVHGGAPGVGVRPGAVLEPHGRVDEGVAADTDEGAQQDGEWTVVGGETADEDEDVDEEGVILAEDIEEEEDNVDEEEEDRTREKRWKINLGAKRAET